jgi:hypothetical protein
MDQQSLHNSDLELQYLSSPDYAASDDTSQRRSSRAVRINSSAAVIPPPTAYSRVQTDDIESTVTVQDSTAADAEYLFNSHLGRSVPSAKVDNTPSEDSEYCAVSSSTQGGILHQLLQAYKNPQPIQEKKPSETTASSPVLRPVSSGKATPKRKWYEHERQVALSDTLATLVGASPQLANPSEQGTPVHR